MTTAQEVLTKDFPPFPFFTENPVHPHDLADPARIGVPSEQRERGVSLPLLAHEKVRIDTNPLPERCQFAFSDGRQCTMPRSDIHPSLCCFHAEREDQLFGDPAPSGVVGAGLDLPELYSACRDLTAPAGVSRALGQVMRLLAQRRISQKEAATFGYLAQLLLQTFSATRAEAVASPTDRAETRTHVASLPEAPPPIPSSDSGDNSVNSRPSALPRNPRAISTYENAGFEPIQNQHLHNNGGGGGPSGRSGFVAQGAT